MEEFARSNSDRNLNRNRKIAVRGKRTKRHRPVSALAAVISASSDDRSGNNNIGSSSSPTTSGEEIYETDEEDMANCLILLAQGGAAVKKKTKKKTEEPSRSRKFSEIGFFVYECKTCNRTFPSFQALGGHRASHRKPKTAVPPPVAAENEKKSPETAASVAISIPIVTNFQICNNSNKINKVHECSICGSEFSSGQALGGHMRRHRTTAAAAAAASTTTTGDTSSRNFLQLDLNLPAPEDDLRESSTSSSSSTQFQFASAKQSIVFSAPALVDCHY